MASNAKHISDQASEDVRKFGQMLGLVLDQLGMTQVELAELIEPIPPRSVGSSRTRRLS